MALEDELEGFIVKTSGHRRGRNSIAPDEDLIGSGIVDSLGLTELVAFIEERFGVTIDDDDVVIDHFRNLHSIERLIDTKRSAAR